MSHEVSFPPKQIVDALGRNTRLHHPVINVETGNVLWLEETAAGAAAIANGMNALKEGQYTVGAFIEEGEEFPQGAHYTDGGTRKVVHKHTGRKDLR